LVSGAEFALEFLGGERGVPSAAAAALGSMRAAGDEAIREICDAELLLSRGIRRVTKLVLFPVRFMFTAAEGRTGTNQEAAAWYLSTEHATARELVAAALRWRAAPPANERARSSCFEINSLRCTSGTSPITWIVSQPPAGMI
jgi:hypothetical protein